MDHFARLGLPAALELEPAALDQAYFALQRQWHPDRFVAKPAEERAKASTEAAALNDAYRTLKDPLRRAAISLSSTGVELPGDGKTIDDPELLMEAMEAREELHEAAHDRGGRCVGREGARRHEDSRWQASAVCSWQTTGAPSEKRSFALRYLDKFAEEARARRITGTGEGMSLLEIHEPGETPLPHAGEGALAVGIDLGTTNSVVAIARDGKPAALHDETGKALVPSVVGLSRRRWRAGGRRGAPADGSASRATSWPRSSG